MSPLINRPPPDAPRVPSGLRWRREHSPAPAQADADATRIPGIPEQLPPGETVRWHGAPAPLAMARRVFHLDLVLGWFALLAVWAVVAGVHDGASLRSAFGDAAQLVGPAAAATLILLGLGAWSARSTIYAVTDRRVVLRVGMVLPMTVNLPLAIVQRADVRRHRDGSGDVAFALEGRDQIGYAILWPHARPWRVRRPEPSLRCVPDVDALATALQRTLAEAAGMPVPAAGAAVAAPDGAYRGAERPLGGTPVPVGGSGR